MMLKKVTKDLKNNRETITIYIKKLGDYPNF